MNSEIICPHCRGELDGAQSPEQTTLMCPYCRNLFSLRLETGEFSVSTTGVDTLQSAYPYVIPDLPRPAGVAAVGVVGIILSSLLLLSMTCLGTTIVAMEYIPGLAEEMKKNMSPEDYSPSGGAEMWVGIVIVLAIGAVYLWASIRLLRRKESARRVVWGINLCGVIIAIFNLIYVVQGFQGVSSVSDLSIGTAFLAYSVCVCLYLRSSVVKNWFGG
jgi:hypothetical protein